LGAFFRAAPEKTGLSAPIALAAKDGSGIKQGRIAALRGIFAEGRNAKLKNPQGCGFLSQFRFYPLRRLTAAFSCRVYRAL
jgi:hypothetical protein